ncbi:flagellar protein FlaG [Halomonas sp. WWR20]
MATSPTDITLSQITPTGGTLTAQQRLETLLAHLPASTTLHDPDATPISETASSTRGQLSVEIESLNTKMRAYGVEFQLDDFDGRVITRLVDRESGDLIRQIPSEEVLRIAKALDQLQGRLITLRV